MRNIYFCGLKHSGKTTLGRLLGEELHLPFYDSDDLFSKEAKMECREYYNTYGREKFEEKEDVVMHNFLECVCEGYVFSYGGGACNNIPLLSLGRNGVLIYLYRDEELLYDKMIKDGIPPYLDINNPRESFHTLFKERNEIYHKECNIEVDFKNYFSPKDEENVIIKILKEEGCIE